MYICTCICICICICISISLSVTAAAAGCGRHFNELCSKRRVKNAKCIFARGAKDSSPFPPLPLLLSPLGNIAGYPRCCRLTASAYQLRGWKTQRNCAKLQTRFATGCRCRCRAACATVWAAGMTTAAGIRQKAARELRRSPTRGRSLSDCGPQRSISGLSAPSICLPLPLSPSPLYRPLLGRQATQHLPPPQIISKCQKKNKPKQT